MATIEQHKIIFDNWREFNKRKLLDEVSLYQYTGSAPNPDDPENTAWDSKTVKATAIPSTPGGPAQGDKVPDITKKDVLGFGAAVAAGVAAQTVGENLPALIKGALGLVKDAIGIVLGTALKGLKSVGGLAGKILNVLTGGVFESVAEVATSLAKGALSKLFSAAGITVSVTALGSLSYGLYRAYKMIKEKLSIGSDGVIKNKSAFREGEVVGAIHNFDKWPKEMQKIFCQENPNFDWEKRKMKNPCGGTTGKPDIDDPGTSQVSTSDLEGTTYEIEGTGIKHNLKGRAKRFSEFFVDRLQSMGITNKYSLAGAIAVFGKESNFKMIAEKGNYSVGNLASGKAGVPSRLKNVFRHQGFGEPTREQLEQLSGGGKNAVALFNITYGYKPFKGYNTYQEDKYIPHSLKVVVDGNINPELYNEDLPGWKYRGRGPIQTTFRETYRAVAKAGGMDVEAILDNPDIVLQDAEMAILFSVAQTKATYGKTKRNRFIGGEPTNLTEGVEFMVMLAAGGGGSKKHSWWPTQLSKAIKFANRHVRVDETVS